jgi:hypothetical protein
MEPLSLLINDKTVMLIIGGICALILKIIWDWLQGGRMGTRDHSACMLHQDIVKNQDEFRSFINDSRERLVRLETLLVAGSESIKDDLEKGRILFSSIESNMKEMKAELKSFKESIE